MRPSVPLQLIRASETLTAEDPIAHKGSLTSVPTEVGSEVGGLAIYLATIWKMANVLLLPKSAVAVLARIHTTDTVGTGTGDPSEPASGLGRITGRGECRNGDCRGPVRALVVDV